MLNFETSNIQNEFDNSWIGCVPEDWQRLPLRAFLKIRNEKNDPIKTTEILSLSIAHGVTRYFEEGRGGNKAKDDLSAYKIAHKGDIVMNSMNIIAGAVGRSDYFGAISPVYYALYPFRDDVDMEFVEFVFAAERFQREFIRLGKGILIKKSGTGKLNTIRMKVSTDDLKSVQFPLPPFSTQKTISKFLKRRIKLLDNAISEKRTQIALLNERKAILIQNAVTRGLNPDTPMKDSGVDWIREIPTHWSMKRIKYLLTERNDRSTTGSEELLSLRMNEGLIPHNDVSDKYIAPENLIDYKITSPNQIVYESNAREHWNIWNYQN